MNGQSNETSIVLDRHFYVFCPLFSIPCRKRSHPHEGIVYLIAPEEWMNANDVATLRGGTRSLSTPIEEDSEDSGSNSNISYTALSGKGSRVHSRHSSVASSQIGLVNEETYDQSGYESDSSNQDAEMSFSVPNSPSLDRRTSIISLEERSRLLSHNSITDLTMLSGEEDESKDTMHPLKKRSLAFSIDANSDSEDDGEELHHHRMNSVLSTVRQNRSVNKRNHVEMMQDRQGSRNTSSYGGFGDLMTKEEIKQHSTLSANDTQHRPLHSTLSANDIEHRPLHSTLSANDTQHRPLHSTLPTDDTQHRPLHSTLSANDIEHRPLVQHGGISNHKSDSGLMQTEQTLSVKSNRLHSESSPLQPSTQSNEGGAGFVSRIKGKLFRNKMRSVTTVDNVGVIPNESDDLLSTGSSKQSKSPSFNQSKIGGKAKKSINGGEDVGENNDEELLKEAMKSSKTRFIIV